MTTGEGRFEAIVLAAGAGSRFGGGKLTAPWRGGLLIEAALDSALTAPVRRVWLVVGADPAIEGVARAFAQRRGELERLELVFAADHAYGLSASLAAGLAALPEDCAGAFDFLGDMPAIPPDIPPRLAEALSHGASAAAPHCGGGRGHPVLFAAGLFARLQGLSGDTGGRAVIDNLGGALALVETSDEGVLFDVDRPEDLRS